MADPTQDQITLEQQISNLNLPRGISIAKGFDKFKTVEGIELYWRKLLTSFINSLIQEILEIKGAKINRIIAISGSLLFHYLYLQAVKNLKEMDGRSKTIYAAQTIGFLDDQGQGKKTHVFSSELRKDEIAMLIEDIVDTARSSKDIEKRADVEKFWIRVFCIKHGSLGLKHPQGNGSINMHEYHDEWIATTAMNSGIGETVHTRGNPNITFSSLLISKLERACLLPLALNDRLTSDWTEEDVLTYIRLLKEHSYFPEGIIPPELDEMYDAAYKFKNGLILKEELWLVLKLAEQRILGIEQ